MTNPPTPAEERIAAILHNVRELAQQTSVHTGESTGNLAVLERHIEDGLRELVGLHAVQPELLAAEVVQEREALPPLPMPTLLRMGMPGGLDRSVFGFTDDQMREYARAAISAQAAERQGWQWVPKEPTDDAIKAGVRAFQRSYNSDDALLDWRAFYRAILSAAPQPPTSGRAP